jgi:hypothetical protein
LIQQTEGVGSPTLGFVLEWYGLKFVVTCIEFSQVSIKAMV